MASIEESPERSRIGDEEFDGKKGNQDVDVAESGQENGHLQELEVDMAVILKEDGLEDIEGQSPYPEGTSFVALS